MKTKYLLLVYWFALSFFSQAQDLPRSTPEKEGVESQAIIQMIESFDKSKHENHSYMVIRHGKVIAEGWWFPYSSQTKHTMYSISKSWMSTGVGLLVDEGKLSLEAPVISFFPEYQSLENKPFVKDLKVKDLLTMTVGNENKPILDMAKFNEDWVKGFFESPIVHPPGTSFLYNSMASFMLSAIVTKITGEPLIKLLEKRLFPALNIHGVDWETNGEGYNVGGWGIRVKTEDMAKLGLLYLNNGVYNGKRILSEKWVKAATSAQIMQEPTADAKKMAESDWVQGYGYQFWRCRYGAFRGDGAFGQYIIMLPEQDAVVVLTSESSDLQDEINMVWKYLLPGLKSAPLPPSKSYENLKKFSKNLQLPLLEKSVYQGNKSDFFQKYSLDKNFLNLSSIELTENQLILRKANQTFSFPLKEGERAFSKTSFKGPYLINYAKNYLEGLGDFKVATEISYPSAQEVKIKLHYFESPHHWIWIINKAEKSLKILQSFEKGKEITIPIH